MSSDGFIVEYRMYKDGTDGLWHFNPKCSNWPKETPEREVVKRYGDPERQGLCEECQKHGYPKDWEESAG